MRGYDFKMSRGEMLFWIILAFLIAGTITGMQCGCDSTGTMALQAETEQLRSEVKTAVEQVDTLKTTTGDISGELTQIKTTLTHIETTMVSIQNKVTNNNGIPTYYLLIIGGAYALWEIIKYKLLKPLGIIFKGIRK
jgi:hypothetical protein